MKYKLHNIVIPITPNKVKRGGVTYTYHRLRYVEDGRRHRPTYKTLELAKAEAETVAIRLSNARTAVHQLTPEDAASIARVRQILASHQLTKPVELIISEYARAVRALPEGVTLDHAVQTYNKQHDTRYTATIGQIAAEFLAQKAAAGKSAEHLAVLRQRLAIWSAEFNLPCARITTEQFTKALNQIQSRDGKSRTARTRNHYRAALTNLGNYARKHGHVPRDWSEHLHLEKYTEHDDDVTLDSAETVQQLFDTAQQHDPELIPGMVLLWFCAFRTRELCGSRPRPKETRTTAPRKPPQDWAHVDLEHRQIFNAAGKVRAKAKRYAHLPENAVAWLILHQKKRGPIVPCSEQNFNRRLNQLAARAQPPIELAANGHRHTAISVRVAETEDLARVSREVGTSVSTLEKKYISPMSKAAVQAYRNILPKRGAAGKILELGGQKTAKTFSPSSEKEAEKSAARPIETGKAERWPSG